jgi:GR25 family glycosyltransferase involved in LPS biosynthesis
MKAFVITIGHNTKSLEVAERCIASGKKHGIDIKMFSAITPENDPLMLAETESISPMGFEEKYSRNLNCISAFLSHYNIWKWSAMNNEQVVIFEHDAVVFDKIPTHANYLHVMNIGKPSYGKFKIPTQLGVNPLTTKEYFPGAHAYMVKPSGANLLMNQAQKFGRPTDIFLNKSTFPWLQEYYPFVAEARDSFTTIQNETGCVAKHNYGDDYEVIDA